MIQLPNGCHATDLKVSPKNWDKNASTKKDWFIHYTFFDPEYKEGKRCQVRGMNSEKILKERQHQTRLIIKAELENLQAGYNPFKRSVVASNFELSPDTPFTGALWEAFKKVKGVEGTLQDIKSVIKGVEKSARQLNFHNIPISKITRKYFVLIFEQCYKTNPKFSAGRQNKYRAYLMKLYKVLIKMEAAEVNPLHDIEKENEIKKERIMPTEEQRLKISEFLKENYYPFWRAVQIFFASGSREIELMRVQAKHVDLKNQSCLYLIKKRKGEDWVRRPIADKVFYLWQEIMKDCGPEDYLFSKGLLPGPTQIRSEQFGRRWQRHVKGTAKTQKKEGSRKKKPDMLPKLNIDIDLYTLKHLNTTEISEKLDSLYNPAEDVKKLTGHTTTAMIVNIYDTKNKERKDEKIKRAGNTF